MLKSDPGAKTALARQLASSIDPVIRQRGAQYFAAGHVRIKTGSATYLLADVRGSAPYQVELIREERDIHASCTCPYFDGDLCKHIWATLLAADARQLLQGDGDNDKLRLLHADLDWRDEDDDFADDDSEDEDIDEALLRKMLAEAPPWPAERKPPTPDWRKQLAQLQPIHRPAYAPARDEWSADREPLYVIDVTGSPTGGTVSLEVLCRDLKKDGSWGKPKSRYIPHEWLQRVRNPDDRQLLTALAGAIPSSGTEHGYGAADYAGSTYPGADFYGRTSPYRYRLSDVQLEFLLPVLCRTGRCRLRLEPQDDVETWLPMQWQDGEPWQFRVEVRRDVEGRRYAVRGMLHRAGERMPLAEPLLLAGGGFLFTREHVARYAHHGALDWLRLLRDHHPILVPEEHGDQFLSELLHRPELPPFDLPDELRYEEIRCTPRPRLAVTAARDTRQRDRLQGKLTFDYGGTIVAAEAPGHGILQDAPRRLVLRDPAAERDADERLRILGWHMPGHFTRDGQPARELSTGRLPKVVTELTAEGWHVEAEGKVYRSPGRFDIKVSSGVDWFELHGTVEFGDLSAHLPHLLAAAKRGESMVLLDDGSYGVLPQAWLKKYGSIVGLGAAHDDHIRFTRGQVGLLDALLSAQPQSRCDALFAQVRDQLQNFTGIAPAEPPAGFRGTLRRYQQEGLGWLYFLQRFGFGGCLADDMGLGKTVQVLALLEARRERRAAAPTDALARIGPSLVVVPKSLIFNWYQEAARFAPRLHVLDHTGLLRRKGNQHFEDYDLILTTYGTLRRDAVDFKDVQFDYVILDEAQAIKNADSVSAKAVRLLRATHRLAMSGTPVENHLGELWSLFEFLNPGMLGASSVFKLAHTAERNPDDETRRWLAHALRPFLLRRTKQQVLPDLPPKLEQTLYCELDAKQRKLYDELRDHYRKALLKRIERDGMARSKIQILEALLRLRQAAIHPGLLDPKRLQESSAKLDVLMSRLREVHGEGHKTLVFSQFTSMLSILRENLEREDIPYEYLDGRTKDREERVTRFQTDADCKLFLISLKAGGVGLNLTAAQYIFLLDPWWNPAVEAQAIDRAHRMGQTRSVFAYRLIARDTIEEKVLELQNVKRDLADAIIGADTGLIRDLGREDLERLLS